MVSIITINYNGYTVTCELLDSLKRYESYSYEVIVVDNASKEDEGHSLKERYPEITVVCSDKNLGFAGGNNLGYTYAKGNYILYLNNDITIKAPFLQNLVERLRQSGVGAVSPMIKYEYAPDIIQYAGYTPLSVITLRNHLVGVGETDKGQYNQAKNTAYVHGAAMMLSRDVINRVGMMTDIYFLFYEELDWSMRIKESGYELWYEPRSVVFHKESVSTIRGSALRTYYLTRSRLLFARRNNHGFYKYLSCLYQLLVVLPKNVLSYAFHKDWGLLKAYCRGCYSGCVLSF